MAYEKNNTSSINGAMLGFERELWQAADAFEEQHAALKAQRGMVEDSIPGIAKFVFTSPSTPSKIIILAFCHTCPTRCSEKTGNTMQEGSMRRAFPVALCLAFILMGSALAWSGEPDGGNVLSPNEMRAMLERIRTTLVQVHPAPFHAMPEKDFDALYARLVAECGKRMTAEDFCFVANRLVLALDDPHTQLWIESAQERFLPVALAWESDGLGIVDALPSHQDLRGSRILAIEDIPIEEIGRRLDALIPAENFDAVRAEAESCLIKKAFLERILDRRDLRSVRVRLEKGGAQSDAVLPLQPLVPAHDVTAPDKYWRIIPKIKAGYFSLRRCQNTLEYQRVVGNFFYEVARRGYDNVIIDLRGNGGGASEVVDAFLVRIAANDLLNYSTQVRVSNQAVEQREYAPASFTFEENSNLSRPMSPGWSRPRNEVDLTPIGGRVYVLVDRGTFSSGNWFAVMFKDNCLATLVGEKTGNAPTTYGDLLTFPLHHGLQLSVSHKYFQRPDPLRDPEDGLTPDVYVPTRLADRFSGRDPQMEWVIRDLSPKDRPLTEEEVRALVPHPSALIDGPRVIETFPPAGAMDVDPNIKEVRVVYDRNMSQKGYAWCHYGRTNRLEGDSPRWISPTTCVKTVNLKAGSAYQIWFNLPGYEGFRSEDGQPAVPYHLYFMTKGGVAQ